MPIIPKSLFNLRFVAMLIASAMLLAVFNAWRADRRDRAQLTADLATANQALAQANTRQHARDAQLRQALAAIDAQKASATKTVQILRQLPKTIPLPAPVMLQAQSPSTKTAKPPCASGLPGCGRPEGLESTSPTTSVVGNNASDKPASAQQATIPVADLKPLYDFALDCQACQAKLNTAQADLADEKAKTAALTRERDAAVRIAKGGSIFRRIEHAAKWFLIGAAAGAIAAKAHP
jgi:hypothetical protein